MAYAVTHIITTIVILDIFRHYVFNKKRFPRYLIVVGGIAGLAPDLDIPLTWLYNVFIDGSVNLHRLFTHSFFFPAAFVLLALFLWYYKNAKWAKISAVIAFGWLFHILLDWLYGSTKGFLWPLEATLPAVGWNLYPLSPSIDAILLVLWLVHEEAHSYVKDYF